MPQLLFANPMPAGPAGASPPRWTECGPGTDTGAWVDKVRRFHDYWHGLRPRDPATGAPLLPGRQHVDPLAIPDLISRLWMVDVVRVPQTRAFPEGLRYRYRLVGTKEVETLEREVTGQWVDEVHANSIGRPVILGRFAQMVERRVATYRKGPVYLVHHKDHQTVENCMAPLAADGRTVDMIAVCSMLFWPDGREA